MSDPTQLLELATLYHDALPRRIRDYLNCRGIPDAVIKLHLLGWNGERITIPIFDREGRLAFFKLAKDPDETRHGPKMLTPPGASAELYGWERVRVKPSRIVICEGEFDRLVLEAQGFPAVTSTGGAGVFRAEWAEAFAPIPEVFVCFDRDDAGRNGTLRVARMIEHAKIVEFPEEVGPSGDVTDFFVRLGRTRPDFERLLEAASPAPEPESPKRETTPSVRPPRERDDEVARLKAAVPIASFIDRYLELRPSGKNFTALCPFHDDHNPSFFVYPPRRTFRCYGCGAHGDVLEFLMRVEKLSFPEALRVLRELPLGDG